MALISKARQSGNRGSGLALGQEIARPLQTTHNEETMRARAESDPELSRERVAIQSGQLFEFSRADVAIASIGQSSACPLYLAERNRLLPRR